jgi:hypothetical protein
MGHDRAWALELPETSPAARFLTTVPTLGFHLPRPAPMLGFPDANPASAFPQAAASAAWECAEPAAAACSPPEGARISLRRTSPRDVSTHPLNALQGKCVSCQAMPAMDLSGRLSEVPQSRGGEDGGRAVAVCGNVSARRFQGLQPPCSEDVGADMDIGDVVAVEGRDGPRFDTRQDAGPSGQPVLSAGRSHADPGNPGCCGAPARVCPAPRCATAGFSEIMEEPRSCRRECREAPCGSHAVLQDVTPESRTCIGGLVGFGPRRLGFGVLLPVLLHSILVMAAAQGVAWHPGDSSLPRVGRDSERGASRGLLQAQSGLHVQVWALLVIV